MKYCKTCDCHKPRVMFAVRTISPDGLRSQCRGCVSAINLKYYRSKVGLITRMYNNQKCKSSKRGHGQPSYSKKELILWVTENREFTKLFSGWRNSGYQMSSIPSCDRLDDYKPYSLDNLRLITWEENNAKGRYDVICGNNNKKSKGVTQLSLLGLAVNRFYSLAEAMRRTQVDSKGIAKVCNGTAHTAGGFKWVFSNNKTKE